VKKIPLQKAQLCANQRKLPQITATPRLTKIVAGSTDLKAPLAWRTPKPDGIRGRVAGAPASWTAERQLRFARQNVYSLFKML